MGKNVKTNIISESKDLFASLFRYMNTAVFIIDKDVRVQCVNDSFKVLFQKTEKDVLNRLCGNAIGCVFPVTERKDCGQASHCTDCKLRKGIIKCMTEKGDPINTVIEREFLIGNTFIRKNFLITLKHFEFNNLDYGLVIALDVTELESQRKNLKELNELKNEFLGIAAHDLRNPIAAIMNASSILSEHYNEISNELRTKLINMIQNSSEFMLHLVNDLLDVSTIEAGKLDLKITQNDYVEFIKDCLILNELIAKGKKIEIKFEVEGEIPKIPFDKTKIKQVIDNLLTNAIKYSFENSNITINIKKDEVSVVTEVIDQGVGIPEKELPKIFNQFYKSTSKPTEGEKSTGLGLAIAKKIVQKHNGEIGVKSKVGQGSTFYFSLPITQSRDKAT